MKNVIFSTEAERDLEEIGDYVARDNPERAVSFIQEIRAHCQRIGEAPLAYVARPEIDEGVRCCMHGHYVIFFYPSDNAVEIARVLHGARDLLRLFGA